VIQLYFHATNNVVEYEVLVNGLRIISELGVQQLYIRGNSELIINQVMGELNCHDSSMVPYLQEMRQSLRRSSMVLNFIISSAVIMSQPTPFPDLGLVMNSPYEDITNMDTPIVVAYNSKVKLFFSIIIFNTCDEWTLHHDMCSMSFTEVLTWIKEGVDHAWKGWIMKHLLGTKSKCSLHFHQVTTLPVV
jgi:hypothetical protein